MLNPCQNGLCIRSSPGAYECKCAVGFEGVHCEKYIDVCASKPCKNNATCSQYLPGTYSCECAAGWSGALCDVLKDNCQSAPCKNGAACTSGFNYYSCKCPSGLFAKKF